MSVKLATTSRLDIAGSTNVWIYGGELAIGTGGEPALGRGCITLNSANDGVDTIIQSMTTSRGYQIRGLAGNAGISISTGAGGYTEQFRINTAGDIILKNDTDTYWSHPAENTFAWTTYGIERVRIGNSGIGIGTVNFGTGTGMLAIANGTVTGMAAISNQGQIFCEGGELKAMDGSGNITPFSPHSELDNLVTNLADPLPHTYVSTNSYLGKKKIVNMASLIEEIEKLSGKTLVTYEDVPLRDWTADQDSARVQRDLERLKIEAAIDEINTQIAEASQAEKKNELQQKKSQLNKEMPSEYIPQHPPKWMQDRGVMLNL